MSKKAIVPTPEQLAEMPGRLIGQGWVEIITVPTCYDGEWRCLANVAGALCVIVVSFYANFGVEGKGN